MKTRGTAVNPHNRYQAIEKVPVTGLHSEDANPATQYYPQSVKSIIARNQSPDVPFTQSINPYQGCEHGCIYCYARPSHAWLDWSPGLDFETRIVYKTNALERLREEIKKPGYVCDPIAFGTNTDPYQPLERKLRITRKLLRFLLRHRHPVTIVTKGALILRDLDLLSRFARRRLISVVISITTLDAGLKRIMEPRTAAPAARLRAVEALREAGIPAGVLVAPIIPRINEAEIEAILKACAAAGAQSAGYVLLRLPLELKTLFEDWLQQHFPQRKQSVLNRLRAAHHGRLYDSTSFHRQRGDGIYAELIAQRFRKAVSRYALDQTDQPELDCSAFIPPMDQWQQHRLL